MLISFSGCGRTSSATYDSIDTQTKNNFGVSDFDYDSYEEDYSQSVEIDDDVDLNVETGANTNKIDTDKANTKSKLVYESTVNIDTLEFAKAKQEFESLIDKYNGFIESQSITDDGGNNVYIYKNDDIKKHHTLCATVRIPSDNYDNFMSETSGLGDVRSSNEVVTNMTQTYGTLQAQLEIYETEYQTYMQMLSDVKDDSTRLEIKEDITEISVQIATIKSQMAVIDTDVEYSTVNITINEVEEYMEEKDTSTFANRLVNTFKTSWKELLNFLENMLFVIILNWYKAVFVVLFIWLFAKLIHFVKKPRRKKYDKNKSDKHMCSNNDTDTNSVNEDK